MMNQDQDDCSELARDKVRLLVGALCTNPVRTPMKAKRTTVGKLYTRLNDFTDRLENRLAANVLDVDEEEEEEPSKHVMDGDRITINEDHESVDPVDLDDGWDEIDLEEAGIR